MLAWLVVAIRLMLPHDCLIPKGFVPHTLVTLYLILALPINRPLLLPAAVDWNRHR